MKRILLLIIFLKTISVVAQTTVTIGNDTVSTLYGPMYIPIGATTLSNTSFLSVYNSQELLAAGCPAGKITRVSWYKQDASGYPTGNAGFEIYIKNTLYTECTSPIMIGNETWNANLVYQSNTQSLSSTSGWIDFDLTTPFYWNGSDNILVMTKWKPNGSGTGIVNWQSTTTVPRKTSFNLNASGGVANTFNQRPNLKLFFSAQPIIDAGVVSIDSVKGQCPGSTNAYATIKNFGSDTITSTQINWTINGVLQSSIPYAGTLAPLATVMVPLGSVTFSSGVSQSLTAWTTNPNGLSDTVNFNDTITINNLFPGLSGSYTINSTGNPDFYSFSSAVSSLENNGVCGPVEFLIDAGTYNEKVFLHKVVNASSINTIIFRSSTNDSSSVVLSSPTSILPDSNFTLRLDGSEYVSFESMTISRTDTNYYSNVVEIAQSSNHNTFQNINFMGPSTVKFRDPNGLRCGLYCQGNLEWNDLIIQNNYFYGNANGVWLNGSSSHYSENVNINNNTFETFYCAPYLQYLNSPLVENNIITRNDTTERDQYFAIFLRHVMGSPMVLKNIITGYHATYGIRVDYFDSTTTRGLIANNFVQLNPSGPGRGIAINFGSKNLDIFNNSVNVSGPQGIAFQMNLDLPGAENNRILNNIFKSPVVAMILDSISPNGIAVCDNNCLYTLSNILASYNASVASTLSDWVTLTQHDSNSVDIDPNFFSFNDLHTTASGLSNAGSPLAGLQDDIDGDLRNLIHPDIGADEFTNVGINESDDLNMIKVFPNPAQGMLTIDASNQNDNIDEITLMDISGRILLKRLSQPNICRIDISNFSKGFYFIKIDQVGNIVTKTIIIN